MAFARDEFVATGGQTNFTITFPFLDSSHVIVEINGTPTVAFSMPNTTTVILDVGATANDAIVIQRDTPMTPIVGFTSGVPITQENMDTMGRQFTFIAEELRDDNAVPVVAAAVTALWRLSFVGSIVLETSGGTLISDDTLTIPVSTVIDDISNTSPVFISLPGSDVIRMQPGRYKIEVYGQVIRGDLGTDRLSMLWDMVDITNSSQLSMNSSVISLGHPLINVNEDGTSQHFQGHAFISLQAVTDFKLRMLKADGSDLMFVLSPFLCITKYGA